MLNIILLFDDDGIFDELRPGVPQLSVYSVQKLTSTRALQLFPLLHLQLRRLLLDLLACSYLAGESSGKIWNSWLGKPRATHTKLFQKFFSELRHRSNYTHINTATRFWILQCPADARRECQTWPNLKIILFSPGSTVWSSCVETIKNFQALRNQSLCIPQISSRGQCLHVTMDFFRFRRF